MKKLLSLITALSMVSAAFCSCGKDPADTGDDDETSINTEDITEPSSEENTEPPTDAEERICSLDLSESTAKEKVTRISMKGVFSEDAKICPADGNVLHRDVVGRYGMPAEIVADEFESAVIVFEYDPELSDGVPPENLILLHYNENDAFYDTIESHLDAEKHKVSANITEPGVYLLADAYEWYAAWGQDVSKYSHDTVFRCDEFGFSITVPKEIQIRHVSDYLKDDEEGKCQTLLECEQNDVIQIGIEYLERPGYAGVKDFASSIHDIILQNAASSELREIPAAGGEAGQCIISDFSEEGVDNAYSINCFFPVDDTSYINIWFGCTDEEYIQKALDSLATFTWDNGSPQPVTGNTGTDTEKEPPVPALTADDVSFSYLPEGVVLTKDEFAWQDTDGSFTGYLYTGDCTAFKADAEKFDVSLRTGQLDPKMESDALMKLCMSGTPGVNLCTTGQKTLSNGCEGELFLVCYDGETKDDEPTYIQYGWFTTPDPSQRLDVAIVFHSQEDMYELQKIVESIDVK